MVGLAEYIPKLSTLVQLLQWRAASHPKRIAFTFLVDGEAQEVKLTYGELDRRARAIGAVLQGISERGDRALLLYLTGPEYVAAFFGCLYAARVAVPAYPPRLNRNIHRLHAIVRDARPSVALTTSQTLSRLKHVITQAPELSSMRWVSTDSIDGQPEQDWREPDVDEDTLAFLQYTSGSTAAPKGVMLNHGNLIHNSILLASAFEYTSDSRCVSWLPIYHDMGLIGGILQPLFGGFHCTLLSPASFLQRPLRWLQAISRERATISGGPNFAYELCAQKIDPHGHRDLDLSSWSVAFNGSEPIRADTIEKFTAAFAPCGFRRESFLPCYGLAEATLIVSGGPKANAPIIKSVDAKLLESHKVRDIENAQLIVSSGQTFESQRVVIVRPETLVRCATDEIGEVWVAGPSVAQGYWNRPTETAQTFQARLAAPDEGPFLRTGDLGFLKHNELFVTGRLKDLIIIRGLNYYPQDIELTVEKSHKSLRPGGGVAFAVVLDREERLVIVQEVAQREQPDFQKIIEAIREAVADQHDLKVYAVALIKPGTLPKTSSGKIQRQICRNSFLAGKLELLASWQAENMASEGLPSTSVNPPQSAEAVESWLRTRLADYFRLDVERIDPDQPITRYGLDSLGAIELVLRIESELGIALPIVDLLEGHSIKQLAHEIRTRLFDAGVQSIIPSVSLAKEAATHPLSVGQSALWFLHGVSPESAAYNITSALRIRGELDQHALRRVFQKSIDRHPQLRTTFVSSQGEPLQLIHEQEEVSFDTEDTASWSETRLHERLTEEAHRPFDLKRGPLFRIKLFTRSPQEHVLLLAVHHIVADLWSLSLLMREMKLLYEAEKSYPPAALAPLELQYVDYVHWQRQFLASNESAKLWSYWQKQLAGELPLLNLPLDRPRPALQTYRGAAQFFNLSAELVQDLKNLGQGYGATLYMTLLAAFQVLLHRYTNQQDILVGTPSANRSSNRLRGVVGYFVNPLVMRGHVDGNASFNEFLQQIRQTVLDALSHQEMPFALLIEKLQPHRDYSRSPLFQAMFALQKTLASDGNFAGFALGETYARTSMGELELEAIPLELSVAQFDLTLLMTEVEDGGLAGSFQYNTDLFEESTIARLCRHFQTLLVAIVKNPHKPISALSLLSTEERQQQLYEWNDTARQYGSQTLPQLFEAQVARTPKATALVFKDEQLSYRELNEWANQVAHLLRKLGIGPESRVGIMMERSVEMVVSLLGVLKAGGAYVPLDMEYPAERRSFMLKDSGCDVLLTQQRLIDSLPVQDVKVVCVDSREAGFVEESTENLESGASPENLAYVIYTSGSTGQPKGVMICHGGLTNYLNWCVEAYRIADGKGAPLHSPIGFDLSITSLFAPLLAGRSVTLLRGVETEALPEALRLGGGFSLVKITPSHLELLNQSLKSAEVAGVTKTLIVGGEALRGESVSFWRTNAPETRIINEYGPTETVVGCCAYEVTEKDVAKGAVPIGRPISNTQAYVLNEHQQLTPIGVTGELYIGGVGVARGYLSRPELTAERFIPDPFSREPGARLYRTGDLTRYLPDGNIEFLGRCDDQVKIRGFRVELGEIEAALSEHRAVVGACVIAREYAAGERRLIAYVVVEAEATIAELRAFLSQKLPSYMLPSTFLMLDKLPLTAHGKIDRTALPAPDDGRPELQRAYVAPRTREEKVLVQLWSQALGVKEVGVDDDFYELGGHSLLAVRVISRIRDTFDIELPLRTMLESPTVATLARALEEARSVTVGPQRSKITPVSRETRRVRRQDTD